MRRCYRAALKLNPSSRTRVLNRVMSLYSTTAESARGPQEDRDQLAVKQLTPSLVFSLSTLAMMSIFLFYIQRAMTNVEIYSFYSFTTFIWFLLLTIQEDHDHIRMER